MDSLSFVAAACAIDVFCSVLLLFICYFVNQTTNKNVALSQQNTENAKIILTIVQSYQNKVEAERANN